MPRRSPSTPPPRRGATVLLALLTLLLAGLAPGATTAAAAATTTLSPDSDVTDNWQIKPSGSSAAAALDDGIAQPTAVPANTYIWAGAAGSVAEVGMSSATLGTNGAVASGQAWFYANTGATTQLRVDAVWNGAVRASVTVAAGQGFGWRSLAVTPERQSDLDDLRLRFTAVGGGDTNVRAAYATITPVTLLPTTVTWDAPGQPVPPSGWKQQYCCAYSATLASAPVRGGGSSARFELHNTDPDVSSSKRAELSETAAEPDQSERWYGFSIYLPAEYWASDPSAEALTQWHQTSSSGSPPLEIDTLAGNWQIARFGAAQTLLTTANAYQTNHWTDWVVHVKWSGATDGFVDVWRDGVLVYHQVNTATKPNDGGLGVYAKFGIYKWGWAGSGPPSNQTVRVIYHDELRIGDQNASYAAVAPR